MTNEDLPERIVPVQHMFPNCSKYKKCCTNDKEFWDKYEKQIKELFYVKQPIKMPPPEGFENYNEDIRT